MFVRLTLTRWVWTFVPAMFLLAVWNLAFTPLPHPVVAIGGVAVSSLIIAACMQWVVMRQQGPGAK